MNKSVEKVERLRTPLDIALSVLEQRGYLLPQEQEFDYVLEFGLLNRINGFNEVALEYNEHLNVYIISARMLGGELHPELRLNLYRLMSQIQCFAPGAQLTYDEGSSPDGSDAQVELTFCCFLYRELDYALQLNSSLDFFDELVRNLLPPLLDYVGQRCRVRVDRDGKVVKVTPTVTVEQCLELARHGRLGRA